MNVLCCVCLKTFPWPDGAPNPGLDHVSCCPSCLADARLGRLVRAMPEGTQLVTDSDEKGPYWYLKGHVPNSFRFEATPEEALKKAGVKEVER